jgi:hypothetical protein
VRRLLYAIYKRAHDGKPDIIIAQPTIKLPWKIDICFNPGAPYEISEIIQGRVRSEVRIGIRNSGGSPLSNCKVYIESVSPPPAHFGLFPALLDGSFVLRHDDPEKLIDIALYWNHLKQYRFSTPVGGFISAESLNYMNETEQRDFVVKFVATECQKSEMFKILVDETRRCDSSTLATLVKYPVLWRNCHKRFGTL